MDPLFTAADFEPLVEALTASAPAVIAATVSIIGVVGVINWVLRKVRGAVR